MLVVDSDCCVSIEEIFNMQVFVQKFLRLFSDQGEWETSVKKKKNRQPTTKSESAVNNRDNEQEEWVQERELVPERERTRTRGGGPPRMRGRGSLDNRGCM